MDANLTDALRAFVAERLPALSTSRCVLAASGGADSTAMVGLLLESGVVLPERCIVGHFDHRLRGAEASARERAAVEGLCAHFGLELAVEVWDAPRAGEAAARDARYAALASMAKRFGARAMVTGHTADDQAETVLMHAMRGAGLHGLAGMAVDAPHPSRRGLRIWRPLLGITRTQTRAYCHEQGIAHHDDVSNDDRAFLRNRMRLDVLPALERSNPHLRAALIEVADGARAAADAIDLAAATLLPPPQTGEQTIVIARRALAGAPAELRPHVFRLAVIRLLDDARDIERKHYRVLTDAVESRTGATLMLPRGLVLTVDADALHLARGPLAAPALDPEFAADLPFDGVAGSWQLRIVPARAALLADGGIDLRLPRGSLVRGRRPGDRVRTRAGSKKLGNWYTDHKIPVRERSGAPVIAYGNEVLWTPWGALSELPHGDAWRVIAGRRAS
jgi:tRNA(Ile)-lysidine synthase